MLPSSTDHVGQYHRVFIGGGCPDVQTDMLLKLLHPDGGQMVIPVGESLLLIKKQPDGAYTQKIISRVQFSKLEGGAYTQKIISRVHFSALEVPRDVDIVRSALRDERDQACKSNVPASTLEADLALMKAEVAEGMLSAVPPIDGGDVKRTKTGEAPPSYLKSDMADLLGATDCVLVGRSVPMEEATRSSEQDPSCSESWTLPVHKAALKGGCEHLRARFDSGMRDAKEETVNFALQVTVDVSTFVHVLMAE
eukprot:gene3387-13427_t